jgi:hypothetical protein
VGSPSRAYDALVTFLNLLIGGAAEGVSSYGACKDTYDSQKHHKQDLNKGLIHFTEKCHA